MLLLLAQILSIPAAGVGQDSGVVGDVVFGNGSLPWWNSSWLYRRGVFLNNSGGFWVM